MELVQISVLELREAVQGRADQRVDVRVTRTFKVSPGRLFDAWLDPKIAGRWLFATASRPMTLARIDARIGGAFRFVDRNDGEHIEHGGVYTAIERPQRLAFTLSLEAHQNAITRVIAEIVPLKAHAGGARAVQVEGQRTAGAHAECQLIVAHEDVPAEHASNIEARWTGMLYGLAVVLDSQPGRSYSSVFRPNRRSR